MNYDNKDIYNPKLKNFAHEPYAWGTARKWVGDATSAENLALIMANYAYEKKLYDGDYWKTLNTKGTVDALSSIVRDTLYNIGPLSQEAKLFASAGLKAAG